MHPKILKDGGQRDLFRSRLDQIINMKHPLVRLGELIEWESLEKSVQRYYAAIGRPGLAVRLILGLHFLKHIYGLSDEGVCASWEENPYFQYFTGEEFFQHRLPIERSSMSHFRARIEATILEKMLQESLAAAHEAGALSLKDLRKVVIDTTVQEKAIAHPTEHGLMIKAVSKLGSIAKKLGIQVRQSYKRVVKSASIMVGRYIHAKQMKRARKKLKFIRCRLQRLVRDITRKAASQFEQMPEKLTQILRKADHIARQKRGDPDYLYSWHAPEVECIGKGKARKPYEFGCKVSLATQLQTSKGKKHFILGAQALHGRPFDGHTLEGALEQVKAIIGKAPDFAYVDKGYRGHRSSQGARVFISGQKRGMNPKIKQDLKRRAVIEPIIGHAKNDGLLGRHWLKGRKGDEMNALLSAIGFNFRQILAHLNNTQRSILPA